MLNPVGREAIILAKLWMGYGDRGLVKAHAILTHAAESMLGERFCAECDATIVGEPVQDETEVAWLGAGALVYCSLACLTAFEDQQANAEGNGS